MAVQSTPKTLKEKLGGRNIFLIGMMGSGKSQTGPVLAKMINYAFVDTDDVIEKASKQSISSIFEKDGEKVFRDVEKKVLKEISQHHSLVIATGGGLVTLPENWGILHQGIVIWLDLDLRRSIKRLESDQKRRPLLLGDNLAENFSQIYESRKPIYLESDLRIEVEDQSPYEVATMVAEHLPSILIDPETQAERHTTEL
ncbi:Shikimate kinase [Prochlorococcus marinus str. NATL1A]|jgi:shikimate kinase|uniref:Shikimate kinase n=1 Tax=Prochlorococcus marinus (strain NATL1A) TaxID=167555 RepID=A2BZT3_PROM1|nr:shikimate kinase [Prochlorococcus marinus]ABM74743.1 Shikimate kinase [Prochlorococcus marinus str. NATL1A]|tara:strand:- start:2170 stop:2766 length:597 start_codon:yes stop_codon:yes gene_type:complete